MYKKIIKLKIFITLNKSQSTYQMQHKFGSTYNV